MELQWPLILFTAFVAWSAGLFATMGIYALRKKSSGAQFSAWVCAAVLLVVGGVCVFFHLQHWERIFNGFGHITSGITQELIAIVVLAVVAIIYLVYLRREQGAVPAWVAVTAIVISIILCVVMAHSYMMASRPAWNSLLQIFSILGSACGLGPATFAIIEKLKGETDGMTGGLVIGGTAINAVTVIGYLVGMIGVGSSFAQVGTYFDNTHPTKPLTDFAAISPFAGDALVPAICAIVCAVAAVVFAIIGRKTGNWKVMGTLAVIGVLASAILLRVVFYLMGLSVFVFY